MTKGFLNVFVLRDVRLFATSSVQVAREGGFAALAALLEDLLAALDAVVENKGAEVSDIVHILNDVQYIEAYRLAVDLPMTVRQSLNDLSLQLGHLVADCLSAADAMLDGGE